MDRRYRITNTTRDRVLAANCRKADNPISRALGLMGKRSLPPGEGLIIQPCSSVTCFFMRFPIDVLFVGADGLILHAIHSMRPWRNSKFVRGSKFVVELPAGVLQQSQTVVGDSISFDEA
jgi:uncharacterized membrane protein (UPF0127 family)